MICDCGNELSTRTAFLSNGELLCGSCRRPAGRGDFIHSRPASVCEKERSVVWQHPGTGEVRYPGRNDVPMPKLYEQQGFARREFTSLRELESFSKQKGVVNEAVHYDRGSGRGFEP